MPYFHVPPVQLGPVSVHVFGCIAALAVFLGVKACRHRAAELDLDVQVIDRLMPWLFLGVVLGAHFVSVALYMPERILEEPFVLIRLWDGISSFGGILGGLLAAFLFFKWLGINMRYYKQALLFGAVVSLMVGRLGCAVIHDHPGKQTTSPVAIQGWPTTETPHRELGFYTEGLRRHDLGLYEFVVLVPLTGLLYLVRHIRPFENFHMVLVLLLYTPARFMLDFLRVFEKRYYGLTPGQYFSGALFFLAVCLACHGLWQWRTRLSLEVPT